MICRPLASLRLFVACLVTLSSGAASEGQDSPHLYGGAPSNDAVIYRLAYAMAYDHSHKAPRWVAYRLQHPTCSNRCDAPVRPGLIDDPAIAGDPNASDWAGVFDDPVRQYSRGHLAPFAIAHHVGCTLANTTPDAAREAAGELNYWSNITPQHHRAFNGAGGVWYAIEQRIRTDLLPAHQTLWVFAGPIFGPSPYDIIGDGVEVAPMFFQIVVWEDAGQPAIEAYLVPHHQMGHGEPADYLVSVRHIEALSGLDFFPDLNLGDQERVSTYRPGGD